MSGGIKLKRGTRAELDYAASRGQLTQYNPIWLTDENILVLCTSATTYMEVQNVDPCVRVYRSTNQSVSIAGWTKVQFDAETYDTNNTFDSTTNYRWTPGIPGYYTVSWSVALDGTGLTGGASALYKNGSIYASGIQTSIVTAWGSVILSGTEDVQMSATDYLEVFVVPESSTSANVLGSASASGTNFKGKRFRSL